MILTNPTRGKAYAIKRGGRLNDKFILYSDAT